MTQTTLVRAYGVCAILSAISFVIGLIVVFAFVDLPETEFDETVILALAGERTAFLAAQWFVVLGSAFAVAAAVGIQLFLGHAGGITRIALAAFVMGSLFVFAHSLIELGLGYELIPEYADADEETRPALEVVGRTLHLTGLFASVAGNLFAFGVGIALFAYASIRSATVPTWLAWLGLASAALAGWVGALETLSVVFEVLALAGSFAVLAWLALMGVVLIKNAAAEPPKGAQAGKVEA